MDVIFLCSSSDGLFSFPAVHIIGARLFACADSPVLLMLATWVPFFRKTHVTVTLAGVARAVRIIYDTWPKVFHGFTFSR